MRIVFFSALYPPHTKGGGELSAHYIARGLKERGHEVTVLAAGRKREEYEVDGVRVVRLPSRLTAKPLCERPFTRRAALVLQGELERLEKADIYHAHDFRSAQALSELGLPRSVVTARDYAQICGSPNNLLSDFTPCPACTLRNTWRNHRVAEAPFWRKPFRVWQYWHNFPYRLSSFRQFQRQIFISHAQRQRIGEVQDLRGVKTQVIYNPVPPEYFEPPASPLRDRTIMYVGTVESYKGVGLLLQAFRQVAAEVRDTQLRIVGAGAQRNQYQRQAAVWGLRDRVSFIDPVPWDKMRSVYDDARILVAPHLWLEPFGRTVVEAMARGKVVVSANAGGPAEIIQSGKTGWLFERDSVEDLTKTLRDALAQDAKEQEHMGQAARHWVMENLGVGTIAAQHERVYEEMLSAV